MSGQTTYLDTSAIVKRYVEETGTDKVRDLYVKVYAGDVKLAFSVWNLGEVLGVLDRARHLDRISKKDYIRARKAFLSENKKTYTAWVVNTGSSQVHYPYTLLENIGETPHLLG